MYIICDMPSSCELARTPERTRGSSPGLIKIQCSNVFRRASEQMFIAAAKQRRSKGASQRGLLRQFIALALLRATPEAELRSSGALYKKNVRGGKGGILVDGHALPLFFARFDYFL